MPNTPDSKPEPLAAQPGDVHARIALEAATLRKSAHAGFRDPKATPALSALMDSAGTALENSVPHSFEHLGKTYWLRAAVTGARMIIFDSPTTLFPMAYALSCSERECGHDPAP